MKNNNSLLLLNEARKYAKQLKNVTTTSETKIAVLGTASIQHFVMVLRYLLHVEGIDADIYEGEYDGIAMEVLNSDSALYQFKPEYVIILPHYLEIRDFPQLMDSKEQIEEKKYNTVKFYEMVWSKLANANRSQIIQANIVIPPEHILGNLEGQYSFSKTQFLRKINETLVEKSPENVSIVDLDLISNYIGKYQWFDYSGYFLHKTGFNMTCIDAVVKPFVQQILAFKGKTRKCLVLDLDNTLWGGVVGDDGVEGIQLDPNNAIGEAYRYFQKYLLELKKRGVILAVCSKNDETTAKEPFEKNSNMILSFDDISCFIANWDDKATNLKRIAEQLNIGIDSLVFFDDNPAERDIIEKYLPEVFVINVPQDPALYVQQLDKESPFEWLQLTKEDTLRSVSYVQNRKRDELSKNFVDYDEYLKALQMKGNITLLTANKAERFTQLLNKSNQFNLRTQRYTIAEINNKMSDGNFRCLCIDLSDKYSSYGLISSVILEKKNKDCFIESWVMSCRVLKRNVEYLMFMKIIETAKEMGCTTVRGEYIPTKKNSMVSSLFESLGFAFVKEKDECKEYSFDVETNVEYSTFIEIEKGE